jgi:hypothetical protein
MSVCHVSRPSSVDSAVEAEGRRDSTTAQVMTYTDGQGKCVWPEMHQKGSHLSERQTFGYFEAGSMEAERERSLVKN